MDIGNHDTEGAFFFQWEMGDGFYTKRIETVNKRKKEKLVKKKRYIIEQSS